MTHAHRIVWTGFVAGLLLGSSCDDSGTAVTVGGGTPASSAVVPGSTGAGLPGTVGSGAAPVGSIGASTSSPTSGGTAVVPTGTGFGSSGPTGSPVSPGAGGATGSASFGCPVNPSRCSNGVDDDGDGKVDAADPECTGPCDHDEGTFATGIPGDNVDACKQDCFFDGNSGMGDDGCDWDLRCDPANPGASAARSCPYDPNLRNCRTTQPQRCLDSCRKRTPNGCDCFGCCAVTVGNTSVSVLLLPSCTAGSFGDPRACPRCTQQPSCLNPCDPCEVCVGRPAPGPGCTPPPVGTTVPPPTGGTGGSPGNTGGSSGAPCPPGITYCGDNSAACGGGAYCLTGCCLIP